MLASWKTVQQSVPYRVLLLLFFLYLFLLSIDLMGGALKMFGKGFAESLMTSTSNPFVGLFIGILATSIIQSSSSTTSIVVGMVGSGVMSIANAIPIVMGANIGTSVTNILVSLAHINRSAEFRRSFSTSLVHDFFNQLAVITLFPLQYYFNLLEKMATFVGMKFYDIGGLSFFSPIKAMTKPMVNLVLALIGDYPIIILLIALFLLFFALKKMVDTLRVLVVKRAEAWFDKVLFRNAFTAFIVGLLLTMLAQSSSITTSLVVPMAGAGILTIEQIFPYTLGANIGTTITAILASLVTANPNAVIVAFAHSIFNIAGICIWWPLKIVPITIAKKFGGFAIISKIIPVAYILLFFFILPITIILIFK
jgi:sodium-dependent phosphate cotransporter